MIKQYEKYKDSGMSWMGVIPTHWKLTKAKYCSSFRMGQTILKEEVIEDGEFPVYSATEGDHYFGRINNPSFVLEPGDIVIPARGNSIGHIALVHEKAVSTQTTIASFIDRRKINCNFLYYFYKGFRNTLFHYDVTAIPQITVDQVKQNPIVLPPLEEQTKIAQYLDHQTAIIDQLIQQKEKLIELLKEKRQVVINEAVTKGLNPNAKMKDSGIEWLGEVPENWSITMLKRFVLDHRQGFYTSKEYDESGFKIARITDIKENNILDLSESPFLDLPESEVKEFILKDGDFVFQRTGAHKKIGVFTGSEKAIYGSFLIRFRFNHQEIDSNYLLMYFDSFVYQNQLNSTIHGGVNPNIHAENIKECLVVIPPMNEQIALSKFYLSERERMISIIEKLNLQIDKLKEYRQSIISEAVTGKIDVRDWQPNNKNAA